MIKISDISDFGIKGCRDVIALVRELAILFLVVFLIIKALCIISSNTFDSSLDKVITIVHKLRQEGLKEFNVAGAGLVLAELKDSNLQTGKALDSIEDANKILEGIGEKEPSIKNAIASLDTTTQQLKLMKKDLEKDIQQEETTPTKNIDTKPQPPVSPINQWVVIVSSDVTPEAAKFELDKLKQLKEFKNAKIILNKKRYRTIIFYKDEDEAKEKLQQYIEQKIIRQDSYIRNLSTWCKEERDSSKEGEIEYTICT